MTEGNKEDSSKMGEASTLLERLQQASDEISTIKSSFSKGMSDLEKIQSILSLDGLDQVTNMMQEFEHRITESERQREEATEGARKYSEELEKEKERLMKLWDAYKNQEEELSTHEKRTTEYEHKITEIEQSKQKLESDLTSRIQTITKKLEENEQQMKEINDLKKETMDFDAIRTQLEDEVSSLTQELCLKDESIKQLEQQVDELKQFEQTAQYKDKFEEVSREYEKEKERLTKLFRLYEDTESECNTLRKDVKQWQEWFDTNEELFSKLFTSADHFKKTISAKSVVDTQPSKTMVISPSSFTETVEKPSHCTPENSTKSKKRIRFRK